MNVKRTFSNLGRLFRSGNARSLLPTSEGCKPVEIMRNFTVCVEGNIASGKTRLLEYFKQYSNIVEVCVEPTHRWQNVQGHNALAAMYEDPARWGPIMQSYVQLTMLQLHTKPQVTPVKIMERSLYSGRYCFIENLRRSGTMSSLDYVVLDEWFQWMVTSMNVKVDLIVYLRTQPEVLQKRILERCRPEEQTIPLQYLKDLHKLHEDWLVHQSIFKPPAPVLVLDANQSLMDMQKQYEEEKSTILFGLETS
ncbi:thymidine kinase 2, mitochondrial-like [Dreissena polymorpha]|uniref:thymidine kinase 2, mitochondrial-like n=1 Tax=Dreissena polymorpha TaxID=45954 RepID=UPI0022647150|nr:thymidine kinase 2, mitochondrial-like [Dreissena polymorpha]